MPAGRLIERARKDVQRFTEGLFSVELTVTAKDVNGVVLPDFVIQGLATRHRENFSPDTGLPMVGLNAHCSFNEKTINDLGIATRNAKNEIIVKDWLVKWSDAVSEVKYKIEEPSPDETVGHIRCLLGEYE